MKNKFLFAGLVFALIASLSLTGCAKTLTPEEVAQKVLDEQALQKAISSKNPDLCKPIQDGKIKDVCALTVEEQGMKSDFVAAKDSSKCGQLTIKSLKQSCEEEIKNILEADKRDEQKRQESQKQNDLLNAIIKSGNISRCKELTTTYLQKTCEEDIASVE